MSCVVKPTSSSFMIIAYFLSMLQILAAVGQNLAATMTVTVTVLARDMLAGVVVVYLTRRHCLVRRTLQLT